MSKTLILESFKYGKLKNEHTHVHKPHSSYLFVELLVPWSSCVEKLFTIKYSVFIIQVILHFPDKEKEPKC